MIGNKLARLLSPCCLRGFWGHVGRLFELYDLNGDGVISAEEMYKVDLAALAGHMDAVREALFGVKGAQRRVAGVVLERGRGLRGAT